MNLPNYLTLARILLVPLLVVALLTRGAERGSVLADMLSHISSAASLLKFSTVI